MFKKISGEGSNSTMADADLQPSSEFSGWNVVSCLTSSWYVGMLFSLLSRVLHLPILELICY